ncbi:sugar phosphate isomerase/epimerase family protein [Paenibacillus harenae]|uniref:sugar phosphate isomerase/epimerase family protein n=1 Tax=Paenibacillus harenae TaxID=306543 RepID=UPI00278F565D|nr:sugar phosphate isomerase/epimerase [Paenibacillus harenae]MDQ0060344.1 sugar phosphate isomerase/epimerase [Paenibacillus harenae]
MLNSRTSTRTDWEKPTLAVHMSWWGMSGLGEGGREWTLEERFGKIAEAGFDGIDGFIPAPEEEAEWRRLLAKYDLALSVNAYPKTAADLERFLQQVRAYDGDVSFINAQVMTPFLIDEPAVSLLGELKRLEEKHALPVHIETHRGTITQDLIRTVGYVRRLGGLPLTIDFSHYVVAGELHTISGEAEELLGELLVHTAGIHARVSNGEQVQVSIGDEGEHPMVPHYKRWWKDGMKHWLQTRNKQAAALTAVCELGPAGYAITIDEYAGRTREISDRWQQSLLLKDILRQAWSEALSE